MVVCEEIVNKRVVCLLRHKRGWMVALLLLSALFQVQCHSVSYTQRTFSKEDANVRYYAIWQEGKPSLLVVVVSENLVFDERPVLHLRFFNVDEPLRIEGEQLPIKVVENQSKASAKFPLTEAQVQLFANGVSKVRLSTLPFTHERVFGHDRMGKQLFRLFQEAKTSDTDF